MIKTIIFDLGGVVVGKFGKELVRNASQKIGIEAEELRKLMNKYEPDLQTGKINHIEFWKKIVQEKGILVSDSVLENLWLEPYKKKSKIDKEAIELLEKLRKKYIVGCISNTQEPHITYNKKRGLFKHFDICIFSSEVGLRKTDRRIFELYLKKVQCKPEEAIFIDDEENNLEQAKELGIKVIHFKSIEQLKKELNNIKVL